MTFSSSHFSLIYSSLAPKIIILQDLTTDNYSMEKIPHNLEVVEKVLAKLAKFHALSFFLANDSHDETIVNYNEPFISETMKGSLAFISQMFGMAVMVLQGWGKEMEGVVDRLKKLMPTLIPKALSVYQKNDRYNVLCHGDFHVANLMFKWKEDPEKIVESIRFVSEFIFASTILIQFSPCRSTSSSVSTALHQWIFSGHSTLWPALRPGTITGRS